ncbi:PLP-dependent aminotransferase family protein [Actinomycetes bacterium KLBMP 9759]
MSELVDALGDWHRRDGPLYGSLADALAAVIRDGTLVRGDRLPPERALAGALALSRSTVIAAYERLRRNGLVVSRRGSGTVVAAFAATRTTPPAGSAAGSLRQRFADQPGGIISLRQAVDDGLPELTAAVLDLASSTLPELLTDAGYHPRGLPELRQAIADHYTAQGLPTGPEHVVVTSGATQAIALIAQHHLRRGSVVAVETPSWPGSVDLFRALNTRLIGVPLDDEGIRTDALGTAITQHRPDLLYVMPTFHNPTGLLMSHRRRRQLAEISARHGLPVVEDNAYLDDHPPIAAFATPDDRILTVGGLAKTVWAGLRIGWVRARPEIVEQLVRLKALADLGSPVLDQAVAARMLPHAPELAARRAAARRDRLAHLGSLLATHLPSWRWQAPDGGSALWIQLPTDDAQPFTAAALRHGVELVAGTSTDTTGTHDAFVRLPFTFPDETLAEIVERLAAAWHDVTVR